MYILYAQAISHTIRTDWCLNHTKSSITTSIIIIYEIVIYMLEQYRRILPDHNDYYILLLHRKRLVHGFDSICFSVACDFEKLLLHLFNKI